MNSSLLYAALLLVLASGAIAQQPNDAISAPPSINDDSKTPKDPAPKDNTGEVKSPSEPAAPVAPAPGDSNSTKKKSTKKSSKKSSKKPTPKRPPQNSEGGCTQVVRREIRDLSDSERQSYFDAIKALMRSRNGQLSAYESFTRIHYENSQANHGYAQFLPWHRVFVRKFELEIQRVDPSISAIPYWEWSADAEAPELSAIFSSDWYGGDGDSRGCVRNGQFADFRPQYRNSGPPCMQRRFNGGRGRIGAFVPVELLSNIITRQRTYDGFRRALEGQPHAAVHNGVGATFSTMRSPSDPIFWLHHTMMDKVYMDWQLENPSRRFREYEGRTVNGRGSMRDSMRPWGIPVSVGTASRVYGGCISYAQAVSAWRRRSVPSTPRNGGGRRNGGERNGGERNGGERNGGERNGGERNGNGGGRGERNGGNGRRRIIRRPIGRRRRLGPRSLLEDNGFPTETETTPIESAEPVSIVEPLKASTEVLADASKVSEDTEEPEPATKAPEAAVETVKDVAEAPKSSTSAPEVVAEVAKDVAEAPKDVAEAPKNATTPTNGTAALVDAEPPTPKLVADADKEDATTQDVTIIDNFKDEKCTDKSGVSVTCPDDRENLLDLRAPVPIPTAWLKMNNQDVGYIREQEQETRNICNKLNKLEGYVSPCALWNREDFIEKLAEKGTKFKVVYGKKLVKVDYNTRDRDFVQKIKREVVKVGVPVHKSYEEVHTKIDKILGRGADYMHRRFRKDAGTVYHEDDNDEYCEDEEY